MLNLLWLVPALPFAGFFILSVLSKRIPRGVAAAVGAGSVGLSALITLGIGAGFLSAPPEGHAFTQTLWTWMDVGGFTPRIALYLDALSLTMMTVVTFIGFLIHLYSIEYMHDDPGLPRFLASLNLFVGAMLVLVLGDSLPLLYLGWEGVGLCSFLLIGFWYQDPKNVACANKAFIVTRVGDTAMGIGLFLLFTKLNTLQIQAVMTAAAQNWAVGAPVAALAALLLLGGAVGKSAQLPLQVWLPDAMAGPTPVSALLHSATMVTAGVYLIARMHGIFSLAPQVQHLTAAIGAVTLLLASFSALTQNDIKRVLAYSSISQIGYMFMALGVGAWTAAIFHFFTHAFFKALLFLAAGAVIHALHHEQDMLKMGGLRKSLPLVFWTFLLGASSLAALPFVTAGFFSKDLILWQAWSLPLGSPWLWAAGAAGALMTSLYTFRMVFLTFFGAEKTHAGHAPGGLMSAPLVVLAFFSVTAGYLGAHFHHFLESALPAAAEGRAAAGLEMKLGVWVSALSLTGIALAYFFFVRSPGSAQALAAVPAVRGLRRFWAAGWGFDWLYDRVLVRPYLWVAEANKNDLFDLLNRGIAAANRGLSRLMGRTENGLVRWYAMSLAIGAVALVAMAVFL